ncbi:MAG: hypothetical protein ACRDYY_08470 [Acidimicrobiales bacterium]
MALGARSARRGGGGLRWLAVGVVLTLLILLIDASLHSSSPGPAQQMATGAWVDRVLPIINESTQEGEQIAGIWAHGLTMKPTEVADQLGQTGAAAAEAYHDVIGLRPPVALAGAAGLLDASLLARSEAATQLRSALGPNAGSSPVSVIQSAGSHMQVGDSAYQLFAQSMPKSVPAMPPSTWLADPAPYQPQAARIFLASFQSAGASNPVHKVEIYAVSTTPSPVSTQGTTQVLPDARAMTVTIVVANIGNQREKDLTVTAAISPSKGESTARDFVDLQPGQAHTIVGLGPLNPPEGAPVTLTVTVTPAAGSPMPPATTTLVFSMPAPPPPTTTTAPASKH